MKMCVGGVALRKQMAAVGPVGSGREGEPIDKTRNLEPGGGWGLQAKKQRHLFPCLGGTQGPGAEDTKNVFHHIPRLLHCVNVCV